MIPFKSNLIVVKYLKGNIINGIYISGSKSYHLIEATHGKYELSNNLPKEYGNEPRRIKTFYTKSYIAKSTLEPAKKADKIIVGDEIYEVFHVDYISRVKPHYRARAILLEEHDIDFSEIPALLLEIIAKPIPDTGVDYSNNDAIVAAALSRIRRENVLLHGITDGNNRVFSTGNEFFIYDDKNKPTITFGGFSYSGDNDYTVSSSHTDHNGYNYIHIASENPAPENDSNPTISYTVAT